MRRAEFSYRSLNDARRGRKRLLAASIIVLLVLAADVATGGGLRSAVRAGSAFTWNVVHSTGSFFNRTGFFTTRASLATENAELRSRLAIAEEKAAGYTALFDENVSLRTMLNLSANSVGVTGPIISSFKSSPYGTFVIGIGTQSGIGKGDLVLTENGFVIGQVTDAQPTTALVKSIFSAGVSTEVMIGEAAVLASGKGGGNALVMVPRAVRVVAGDTVVAPSLGSRPIGVVGKVEEISTSAEQKVFISLPVNLSLVRFVYVIPAHE